MEAFQYPNNDTISLINFFLISPEMDLLRNGAVKSEQKLVMLLLQKLQKKFPKKKLKFLLWLKKPTSNPKL